MARIRVSTLAKEFGLLSRELLGLLAEMDISVRAPSSFLDDEQVETVRTRLLAMLPPTSAAPLPVAPTSVEPLPKPSVEPVVPLPEPQAMPMSPTASATAIVPTGAGHKVGGCATTGTKSEPSGPRSITACLKEWETRDDAKALLGAFGIKTAADLNEALLNAGLQELDGCNRQPTELGRKIGMSCGVAKDSGRRYPLYTEWSEAFILNNLVRIMRRPTRATHLLHVYHLTALENLEAILTSGIKARAVMSAEADSFVDIADHAVLNNHDGLELSDGKRVDEYARCFFNPLPPMYYAKTKDGTGNRVNDFCILDIELPFYEIPDEDGGLRSIICVPGVDAKRVKRVKFLKEGLAWGDHSAESLTNKEVKSLRDIAWNNSWQALEANESRIKAERSAELLMYRLVPAGYVVRVYLGSDVRLEASIPQRSIVDLEPISNGGVANIEELNH